MNLSPKYLALDEIYHLLGLQSRTTRLIETPTPIADAVATIKYGILTLYDGMFKYT